MTSNPLLTLSYEPALEALGGDYFDEVTAAEFPKHILRFRNNSLLPVLGLNPEQVTNEHFIEAFGKFQNQPRPFLALRYHGYQFGEYNPRLGDGRGFLYGQVRGTDGELYDFGTKGSGTTPYSRGGDGKLTLKGGIREVLATETLHQLGVRTSRTFSLVETGEGLWRGDEPSPTRSSVMIRFSRSHIRFGTFERLHYFKRPDLMRKLLDHVIEVYYPHLISEDGKYSLFYSELVQRVAELVAQWMAAGFCHAVLNTDNMSITGESFDYGPYAFIPTYNPNFTAAYFDYYGRYSYGNQPYICRLNLEMLQEPLAAVVNPLDMEAALGKFEDYYSDTYQQLMLGRLGLKLPVQNSSALLLATIEFLQDSQVDYQGFFSGLAQGFSPNWREDAELIFQETYLLQSEEQKSLLDSWRRLYHQVLNSLPLKEMKGIAERLKFNNPKTALLRPQIEKVWEKIEQEDDWEPFYELLRRIQEKD